MQKSGGLCGGDASKYLTRYASSYTPTSALPYEYFAKGRPKGCPANDPAPGNRSEDASVFGLVAVRHFLCRIFDGAQKLFYYFRMKGVAGVERNDHSNVVLEVNTVTAFASHKSKTRFKKQFFRFGGCENRQLRQRAPQGLRS